MRLKVGEELEQQPDPGTPPGPRSTGAVIGAVGAIVLAVAACVLAYVTAASKYGVLPKVAFAGLAIGGTLVGIAWVVSLKDGHGGFGSIGGSFALPIAVIYFYLHRDEMWDMTSAALILGALTWFAFGLALARGLSSTRVIGGISAFVLAITVVGAILDWHVSESTAGTVAALCFLVLAAACIAQAIEMPRLRARPF